MENRALSHRTPPIALAPADAARFIAVSRASMYIQFECSKCGVPAGCNCGVKVIPTAPTLARATEAIKRNPNKSNRAIAEEIGVSEPTVRRARKATASSDDAVAKKRVGRDGKARKLPTTPVLPAA
jgi:hypothetical protein